MEAKIPRALLIDKVSKIFAQSGAPALDGVSFAVQQGEIMALIGESGSGKTTLLRIISGLERPDSGRIVILDNEVCDGNGLHVVPEKRNVGLVFQDYALFPHLTVLKNVLYGLHRLPRSERMNRALAMIELAGLSEFSKRYPHELSGGQQQRVALARALAPKPYLILLDEPFSNLDPMRKEVLRQEVRRIVKETATSALIVTHDTKDALAVSDRVAVLQQGKLQQVGTPEEVYFHSSNEYTASLFGKVNRIPCQLFNSWQGEPDRSVIWLRPSALEITSNEEAQKEFLVGKVIESVFRGDQREILVECGEGEQLTKVTLFVSADRKVVPGTTVTIRRTPTEQSDA